MCHRFTPTIEVLNSLAHSYLPASFPILSLSHCIVYTLNYSHNS